VLAKNTLKSVTQKSIVLSVQDRRPLRETKLANVDMLHIPKDNLPFFPSRYQETIARIGLIDPIEYGNTRNYINGAVSYLSPYISRGVISTRQVLHAILERGYEPKQIEKFIQELAWRDYWQQVWITKGDAIHSDLKQTQTLVDHHHMPQAIVDAETGILAVDDSIKKLYDSGYMHNHLRMYVAAISCNIGRSHWRFPAKWMYYHLLDADWASNALSWQWVAGANSNKKYYANQENVNTYCYTGQKNTFLDVPYSKFPLDKVPFELQAQAKEKFITPLPKHGSLIVDNSLTTLVYNFYNLDPNWRKNETVNRVLLIEPSHFKAYPVSQKSIRFMLDLANEIKEIQIYVGEFNELVRDLKNDSIVFKEHPLNRHYKGTEDPRDWMFSVKGYYPSFFGFWKKCKKELK